MKLKPIPAKFWWLASEMTPLVHMSIETAYKVLLYNTRGGT